MKKQEILKNIMVNYGEENEDGIFEMTEKVFKKFKNELPETLKIVKFKNPENTYGLRENKTGAKTLLKIEIVEEAINQSEEKPEVQEAPEKATISISGGGHKGKGDTYIIKFRNKGEEEENVLTNMSTCTEIKAWLKTLSKKQVEYLHIFNSAGKECRKSAWIG